MPFMPRLRNQPDEAPGSFSLAELARKLVRNWLLGAGRGLGGEGLVEKNVIMPSN